MILFIFGFNDDTKLEKGALQQEIGAHIIQNGSSGKNEEENDIVESITVKLIQSSRTESLQWRKPFRHWKDEQQEEYLYTTDEDEDEDWHR